MDIVWSCPKGLLSFRKKVEFDIQSACSRSVTDWRSGLECSSDRARCVGMRLCTKDFFCPSGFVFFVIALCARGIRTRRTAYSIGTYLKQISLIFAKYLRDECVVGLCEKMCPF